MKLIDRCKRLKNYVTTGVWRETDNSFKVRLIKTLNLSVKAFLDRGLQAQSMSLTYSTILGIVPALALIFAIARGFGFQNLIKHELAVNIPAQQKSLETAFTFVDSYLNQASQGVFVGIGLLVLLWTLISLLSNVESTFNRIWDIKRNRSIYNKVTDYIAICLIVPVLMVCSAGISIFMSTMVNGDTPLAILSPVVDRILEISPLFLAWIAITLSYFLIPNTKVHFRYAAIGGAIAAIGFEAVQQLFVNGQIYVSKYNAIYGSFAFLPLLLIWLQLSWLILLSGCILVRSMQNVFGYNYPGDVSNVSHKYMREISLALMTIVMQRSDRGETPLTANQISRMYRLPVSIISRIVNRLTAAHLIYLVTLDNGERGIIPAVNSSTYTLESFYQAIDSLGDKDFIPYFNSIFKQLLSAINNDKNDRVNHHDSGTLIKDLPIPSVIEVHRIVEESRQTPFPIADTD